VPKDSSPEFTEAQTNAIDNISSHLSYFSGVREELEGCLSGTVDVQKIRDIFDTNDLPTKRGKKVITQFYTAFNFTEDRRPKISAVPKAKNRAGAHAGKSSSAAAGPATPSVLSHKSQLSMIVQRLMDQERAH
jgi:hypothetical protein